MSTKPVSSQTTTDINNDMKTISTYLKDHPNIVKGGDTASDAAYQAAYDLENKVRDNTAAGSASGNNATELASALVQDENTGGATGNILKKLNALAGTLPADGVSVSSMSTSSPSASSTSASSTSTAQAVAVTEAIVRAETLIADELGLGKQLTGFTGLAQDILGKIKNK